MEKVKISYKGKEIEIYDSVQPSRFPEETKEEYHLRRKVLNDLDKAMKKNRNWLHVSTVLIPARTEDGKILKNRGTNEITWLGKAKGNTYIKSIENETGSGEGKSN